jgi:hypothetical protein
MSKVRAKVWKKSTSVPLKPPKTENGFWRWLLQEALRAAIAVAARHWLG